MRSAPINRLQPRSRESSAPARLRVLPWPGRAGPQAHRVPDAYTMTNTQDVPYVGGQAKAPLTRWLAHARARRVSPFLQGDVLELGCGGSVLLDSESVRRAIASYTGVEALAQNVETLRTRFPDATFHAFDLDTAPWPI